MNFSRKSFSDFLQNEILSYQHQAMFEFRYPVLFEENSFLIDQLNFPELDTNIGNIFYNGMQIPIHGTPKFGSNEIRFTMFAEDDFLRSSIYKEIYETIMMKEYHHNINETFPLSANANSIPIAYIIPLGSEKYDTKFTDVKVVSLYNALIKTISLPGGFTSNSSTFVKFDVVMTYSFFEIESKRAE